MKKHKVLPGKKQVENCRGRYFKRLSNENREHLVNLCKSNSLETRFINPIAVLKVQITLRLQ